MQKIYPALLIIVVLTTSVPLLVAPRNAHAGLTGFLATLSFETNPLVVSNTVKTSVESTITASAVSAGLAQQLLEWAQSFVLATLKRQILDTMVNQIVTWIQGGGEPKFITDWESFLGNIAQGAVGDFVQNVLGAGFLCEPFSLQLRIGLLPVKRFGGGGTFSCTLDQIVSNIENFYDDFRNGGWIAYHSSWQPQNNYYGSLLLAWDAQNNYVADKLAAAANEALANNNFLSTKRCYDVNTGETVPEGAYPQGSSSVRCETVTPGKIAGDAVAKAVGADIDFILEADQLGEYVEAIVNALINRIIMEGVNGLRGVHASSGATYVPSRTAGATSGGYRTAAQVPGGIRTGISSYTSASRTAAIPRTELVSNITAAIAARTALDETLTASLALQEPIVATGQNAVACQTDIIRRCPTCQPSIPPDWPARRAIQQQRLDDQLAVVQPLRSERDQNDRELATLRSALAELNTLTDAQYAARQSEFVTASVAADAGIVNLLLSSARTQLAQLQQDTPVTLADVQRDLDYCLSQGGTLAGGIPAPTNLAATRVGNFTRLSWTAPPGAPAVTGYRIERCQGAGCTAFSQIASVGAVTRYDDTTRLASGTYRYRVRATDASGTMGAYSPIALARVE